MAGLKPGFADYGHIDIVRIEVSAQMLQGVGFRKTRWVEYVERRGLGEAPRGRSALADSRQRGNVRRDGFEKVSAVVVITYDTGTIYKAYTWHGTVPHQQYAYMPTHATRMLRMKSLQIESSK